MPVTKQFLKTKPACKVKFMLSAGECGNAESVFLVGDFNDWNMSATPMKKNKNGDFSATLTLPAENSYNFRYIANGSTWVNDPCADGYRFCSFAGEENSFIQL